MLFIQQANGEYRSANEDEVVYEATAIYHRFFAQGTALTEPARAADYIQLKLARYEHEVFMCLFLNNQHQVLACDEMFRGTLDGASVYPREVVKAALQHNAAAVIFAHNHPSGISKPSQADKTMTEKLKAALALIDIRVLDHFIIGATVFSFAEHGLL